MKSEEKLNSFICSLNSHMFFISPFEGVVAVAPTGEKYITLTSSGIKPECSELKTFPTANGAVISYIINFEKYIESINYKIQNLCKLTEQRFEIEFKSLYFVRPYTLYWRQRPTIAYVEKNKYYVRSRLLISNKPVNNDIVTGVSLNEYVI